MTMQTHDQISRQRRTLQREVIIQVLQESNGPLSVREIHARASKLAGSIGIATVYRALKSLQDSGQIEAIMPLSRGTSYQCAPNTDHNHNHFQCRHCHRTFDLGVVPLRIKAGTKLADGFLIEEYHTLLQGLCPDCTE